MTTKKTAKQEDSVAGAVANKAPLFTGGDDIQSENQWGGLPDPENHKCAEWINVDKDGVEFCGVCGKEIESDA
jgi:hypothetical protein